VKILLRRDGAMGDVIHTIPVAKRLRKENPDALIEVATNYPHLFEDNPDINVAYSPNNQRGPYERVIDLNMGFENKRGLIHIIDAYFEKAFGDTEGDKEYWIKHGRAPEVVNGDKGWDKVIGIHPSTSWPCRTLPAFWWNALVECLRAKGYVVMALGTGRDHALTGVIDTRDYMNVHDQLATIQHCAAFVCSESGLMIVAGASDTPIVGMFNITRAEYVMPWRKGVLGYNFDAVLPDIECYGCSEKHQNVTYMDCLRGDNKCLTLFDPEMVAEKAHQAALRGHI